MGESEINAGARRFSRRTFAKGVGLGAGAVAVGVPPSVLGGHGAAAADAQAVGNPLNFGRMFNGLPSFAEPNDAVIAALREIGAPGGMMDAGDNLAEGPVQLIVDPALSAGNPDNPNHTAGTTFVGQFIDHDVTFDPVSQLGRPTDPQ